jgi:hypothetical protein
MAATMPARNSRSAPQFDPRFPRELPRYFDELERLFTECAVNDYIQKKAYACRYVDAETEELWKRLPSFSAPDAAGGTFPEFRSQVIALYPGADDHRRWTMQNLDGLIGEYVRTGIYSLSELGEYYRRFLTMTEHLKANNLMSDSEINRAFVRGFAPDIWRVIVARLQLKNPDKYPDEPWTVAQVYEAARFVLHDTSQVSLSAHVHASQPSNHHAAVPFQQALPPQQYAPPYPSYFSPSNTYTAPQQYQAPHFQSLPSSLPPLSFPPALPPSIPAQPPRQPSPPPAPPVASSSQPSQQAIDPVIANIKQEDIANIFGRFSEYILQLIEAKTNRPELCNFCGKKGHFINDCNTLKEYIALGKCRRNQEGKIVLPGGGLIMRSMPGNNMRERIDEWHNQNPGQLARGVLSSNTNALYWAVSDDEEVDQSGFAQTYLLQEPSDSRIQELERQVFALQKRQVMDAVEIPRILRRPANAQMNQPIPAPNATNTNPPPPAPAPVAQPSETQSLSPAPQEASSSDKGKAPETSREPDITAQDPQPPIHPFANLPENAYIPPQDRVFAGKQPRDKDGAYKVTAPIQSATIVDKVYTRSLKTPFITVTQEELMSIAPELRVRFRDAITPRKVAQKDKEPSSSAPTNVAYHAIDDTLLPFQDVEELVSPEADITASYAFSHGDSPQLRNGIIVPDPIESYLQSLHPDSKDVHFKEAMESHSLRVIQALVNDTEKIECVVDGGCQIVAMSEALCLVLGLIYDPTIYLTMESANGMLDRSLGLARHVPCQFGNILLLFQMHVVRSPAYDILLGRPFDVLTESVVKNYRDENQTITIHDPNTGQTAVIPTFPRTKPKYSLSPDHVSPPTSIPRAPRSPPVQQDFYQSMN